MEHYPTLVPCRFESNFADMHALQLYAQHETRLWNSEIFRNSTIVFFSVLVPTYVGLLRDFIPNWQLSHNHEVDRLTPPQLGGSIVNVTSQGLSYDLPWFNTNQAIIIEKYPNTERYYQASGVQKKGPSRELNPGPLTPKASIIPLDHAAGFEIPNMQVHSSYKPWKAAFSMPKVD